MTHGIENAPTVLIVIVNFRTSQLTLNCLRALDPEMRSFPGARVVVVENFSEDGSSERIAACIENEGWDWAELIVSERNGGYAYGNNLAIRPALAAQSPPAYVWLLNPDTEVRSGALRALVEFMEEHPGVGVGGSGLENPDGSAWSTAFRFPTLFSELESGLRLGVVSKLMDKWVVARSVGDVPEEVGWVAGASMIIRREVFDSIGLMDEEYFLYYEETDFCLRAQRAGWTCWYIPASRVMHIAGQSTGVTDRTLRPRRRPQYLFDSRRRYYIKNHGWSYAALADLAWSVGFASWRVRRRLQRKPDPDPPHLLLDTLRNSVFFKRRAGGS